MRRALQITTLATLSLALAFLVLSCAAYRTQHAPRKKAAAAPPPTGEPYTFAHLQQEVLTPTCATAKCHSAQDVSSGLDLSEGKSYAALVGVPAQERPERLRVKAGDPDASYLVQKLRGDAGIRGGRMPKDGPPYLSREQIDGIVAWIRAGAPAE
ncbi:MAG TPA: hypothetical protein VGE98_16400 [Thermoanaerobaculia bacterium]